MSGSVAAVTEAWCRRSASAASALANDLRKERNLTGDGSLGGSIDIFVLLWVLKDDDFVELILCIDALVGSFDSRALSGSLDLRERMRTMDEERGIRLPWALAV